MVDYFIYFLFFVFALFLLSSRAFNLMNRMHDDLSVIFNAHSHLKAKTHSWTLCMSLLFDTQTLLIRCLTGQNLSTHMYCWVWQMVLCGVSNNSILTAWHRRPASRFSLNQHQEKNTLWMHVATSSYCICILMLKNCRGDLGNSTLFQRVCAPYHTINTD